MFFAKSEALRPTLWRTCRVLANRTRLKVLHELCLHPDQRVSEVAQRLGLSLSLASQSLRALNARGLLMASRIGPLVYYRPGANRSVPDSGQLLRVILKTFSDDKNAHENIFRYATAFTHPRRILIVKTLSECSMQPEEMVSHMNISFSALIRHVRKLVARGFLKRGVHGYICSVPRHKFARFLLDIARYT